MASLESASRVCYICYSENGGNEDLLKTQCFNPSDHAQSCRETLPVVWNPRIKRLEPVLRDETHRPDLGSINQVNPSEPGQVGVTLQSSSLNRPRLGARMDIPFKESFSERVKEVELSVAAIEPPLERSNYKPKLNTLICWEEREHIDILRKRCDGEYDLILYDRTPPDWIVRKRYHKCFGYIRGLDSNQIAYAAQASEGAVIVSNKLMGKEVRADLLSENFNHSDDNLYVAFDSSSSEVKQLLNPLQKVLVEFELKHRFFNDLVRAVNVLPEDVIRSKLLPRSADFERATRNVAIASVPTMLDKHQLNTLEKVVSNEANSPPVLVHGSFGSGKTRVLAIAANYLTKQGKTKLEGKPVRILLCAHHQSSADTFIEHYFGPLMLNGWDIDLFLVMPFHYSCHSKKYSRFYVYVEEFKRIRRRKRNVVVVTTFHTSCKLSEICGRNFFTHIFLDEGGQVREPEALIPLCMASAATRIVIAGDPCQVGPSLLVLGEEARKYGLKYSLLERLISHYQALKPVPDHHIATLNTNYRCHADILAVPQKLFYGPLECQGPTLVHMLARHPLTFVCSSVSADIESDANGTIIGASATEARLLLEEAQRFADPSQWPKEWGTFNLGEICFVTTTRPQLMMLRKIAKAEYTKFQRAKMLTTYTVQGQEFRALFLSTFEPCAENGDVNNPTKSCCDRYVFNTVITRAKSLVVCVGSPLVLLKIEQQMVLKYGKRAGKCWSAYLSNCLKSNTVKVPKSVIPSSRMKKKFRNELSVLVSDTSTLSQKKTASLAVKEIACQLPAAEVKLCQAKHQSNALMSRPDVTTVSTRRVRTTAAPASIRQNILSSAGVNPSTREQKTVLANLRDSQTSSSGGLTSRKGAEIKQNTASSAHHTILLAKESTVSRQSKQKNVIGNKPQDLHDSDHRASHNTTDYPTLTDAAKVTKTVVKKLQQSSKVEAVSCGHSKYYEQHKFALVNDDALLQSNLTPENYKEKFHHLMCWEEKEHDDQLSKRCNDKYSITVFQKGYILGRRNYTGLPAESTRYGYISSLKPHSGDTMSYIKQAGMGVNIQVDSTGLVFAHALFLNGVFLPKDADSSSIALQFTCCEIDKIIKNNRQAKGWVSFKAFVKFELKHTYFQRLHEAVDRLPQAALSKIFPSEAHFQRSRDNRHVSVPNIRHMELDRDQLQVLNMILSAPCDIPVLLVGPFGTGKTRLLARAALHILSHRTNSRVLICAHHQASADTFVEYLGKLLPRSIKMVRLIPTAIYNSSTHDSYRHLYKTSRQIRDLKQFRLVVTTLGTAPHLFDSKYETYFTHILLDEGAQAREPEMLSPLCFVNEKTKIVIAGDHCQVGPQSLVLGDKARDNGLATSLLERLHKHYELKDVSGCHSAALLNNYRCQSGILMLASSLFYGSTLQCRVSDSFADPEKPYPLMFICSSLDSTIGDVPEPTNRGEAVILLDQVERLVKNWPQHEWGVLALENICIMTPSPNQKSLVDRLLRHDKRYKDLHGIEVLKAYEIQGREFRAVFIGTSEVCSAYKANNPTKSTCDRYVFNTAITRSQSLVVAVGNPSLLISVERLRESQCWKEYIRRCIECRTFFLPSGWNQEQSDAMENLLSEVYNDTNCSDPAYVTDLLDDSILDAYRKRFESIPECKTTKLMLSSKNYGLVWDLHERGGEDDDMLETHERLEEYSDRYECYLNIRNLKDTVGIPLDCRKKIVDIKGIYNRRGAFDGDKVLVGVFKDNPEGKCYGKVINVIAHLQELKFVCSIHHDNPVLFAPVDRKSPIIVNLPRLSRDLTSQKNRDTLSSELHSLDVVVFAANSISQIQDGFLPQIKEVIPLSVARHMLFLVCVLKWNRKYRTPLGIVIQAFPKGYTVFEAERLIKTIHNVVYNDSEASEVMHGTRKDTYAEKTLPFYGRAFTIDPENARNLDDALSLVRKSKNVYQLAVHITNTALRIAEGSEADTFARKKGVSFYGGDEGKIMHMLPADNRKELSLIPNQKRDVLSVVAVVEIESDFIQLLEVDFQQAQIESCIQLTYKLAQLVIEGSTLEHHGSCSTQLRKFDANGEQPSLSHSLQLLYRIALHLRSTRIGSGAALCYESNDSEVSCWQAHMLVEELMIWANSQVASCIHSKYMNSALLRCQAPPNKDDLSALVGLHNSVMVQSPSLSRYATEKHDLHAPSLMLPRCLVARLKEAINNSDIPLLTNLLTCDKLYPQLACVQAQFQSLQSRAVYCCTSPHEEPSRYQHFTLNCKTYTHFTSPMRRYLDIQVQRMLLSALGKSDTNCADPEAAFSSENHHQLCLDLNRRMQSASKFEKSMSGVNLAQRLMKSSEVYDAFLIPAKRKGEMELLFPTSGLNQYVNQRRLKLKHFGPFDSKKCTATEHSNSWSLKVTSHCENQGLKVLHNPEFHNVEETKGTERNETTSTTNINLRVYCCNERKDCLQATEFSATVVPDLLSISCNDRQVALECIQNPSSENMTKLKRIFGPLSVEHSKEIPTPKCKSPSPFVAYNLTRTLAPYDCLKVWISWSMREAFLSPCIQLVKLAPDVHICVQHNSSPAECFSSQILSHASKMKYLSINEYVSLWEKVLLAEAAQKSVRECKLIIIKDVCLKWPELTRPANAIDQAACYEPRGMVRMDQTHDCETFFKFRVGDLVCIRYGTDSVESECARAVFHMIVQECADNAVYMKSVGVNCRVSEKLKREISSPCEIQLIPLSTPYQRNYKGLLRLKESNDLSEKGAMAGKRNEQYHEPVCSHLAVHVALGDIIPSKHRVPDFVRGMAAHIMDFDPYALTLWYTNKRLNRVQVDAMKLATENCFQLIQGPPGTGKSETGAHIAYIFAKINRELNSNSTDHRCVLYCGPSNKSVDVVLKKFDVLLRKRHVDLRILRVYSRGLERKAHPCPGSILQEYKQDYTCPPYAERYALHSIIRSGITPASRALLQLEQNLASLPKHSVLSAEANKMLKMAIQSAERAVLQQQFDIIFCTCNETSSSRIPKPRQVIIDEAGMAYEPESLMPICRCDHVVLLGDHKQLQPVIEHKPAKEKGLSVSLFERYAGPTFTTTLTIQYRMHEKVCEFPSKQFYYGKLRTAPEVQNRTDHESNLRGFWIGGSGVPILFCDVVGQEGNTKRDSKCNDVEAAKVVEIAVVLHKVHKVKLSSIALLTPYTAQKELIKKCAEDRVIYKEDGSETVRIVSITESQGDEYGIVVLSTVRSMPLAEIRNPKHVQADRGWLLENIGFLTDEHQVNVGITRSKYGLVIVGNERLLRYDETWKTLIDHYRMKGCIVDGRTFPRSTVGKQQ